MNSRHSFCLITTLGLLCMLYSGWVGALPSSPAYQQCVSDCSHNASLASIQNSNGPSFQTLFNACVTSSCNNQSAAEQTQRVAQDQQTRQFSRQISTQITNRIANIINPEYNGSSNNASPKPGAGDSLSLMPDTLWSTFTWSRLDNNNNSNGSYAIDIFQTTTGIDKNFGNFYFGTTLDYAATIANLKTVNTTGTNHAVGITPYAAYKFSDQFFVSALSGYHFAAASFDALLPDTDTDTYVSELDLNALHVIDHWFMKGKIGARYLHINTTRGALGGGSPTTHSNQDIWTTLADTEVGYAFDNGIKAYNSILFEHVDAPLGTVLSGVSYRGNNIFYYSLGVDFAVSKKFSLGTRYQTDLNNNAVNLSALSLNARLELE